MGDAPACTLLLTLNQFRVGYDRVISLCFRVTEKSISTYAGEASSGHVTFQSRKLTPHTNMLLTTQRLAIQTHSPSTSHSKTPIPQRSHSNRLPHNLATQKPLSHNSSHSNPLLATYRLASTSLPKRRSNI